jgi:hypothetical protein
MLSDAFLGMLYRTSWQERMDLKFPKYGETTLPQVTYRRNFQLNTERSEQSAHGTEGQALRNRGSVVVGQPTVTGRRRNTLRLAVNAWVGF